MFDNVHLLKCIRNNGISEKTKKISLAGQSVASFEHVVHLYEEEKDSILKTTGLTKSAVYPSKLQLQNVKHVLKVFDAKVVAALKLRGYSDTASFIETVLNWWNIVNVSAKGQDQRLNNPHRAVQEAHTTTLQPFCRFFKGQTPAMGKLASSV